MLMDVWVAFTARPYWQGLWILQELILSRGRQDLLCGNSIVHFSLLGWFENVLEAFKENGALSTRLRTPDVLEHPSL